MVKREKSPLRKLIDERGIRDMEGYRHWSRN